MKQLQFQFPFVTFLFIIPWMFAGSTSTIVHAQEATATSLTQTLPSGMFITVLGDEPFANIRLGPSSTIFPKVGRLLPGETAPALGRSPGGDWIQIEIISNPNDEFSAAPNNKGWVYSALVQVSAGTLPIVEPPPTPVAPATATIDPTLAAQFNILPTGTRLPTFTPPPALIPPVYTTTPISGDSESIPMAVIIMSLGSFAIVSFVGSLFIRRR